MSQETTYTKKLDDLGRLLASLFANAAELPHLEGIRLHLEQIVKATLAADLERTALIALIESRQDACQRLQRLLGDSERMATAVRKMLTAHYGLGSEKLAEFGVQPFRGRTRRTGPGIPPPEIGQPADSIDDTTADS